MGFWFDACIVPGVIDWNNGWVWIKLVAIAKMTWFHYKLVIWKKAFEEERNEKSGKHYRLMNEVPTVLMLVIVFMVIVKPI